MNIFKKKLESKNKPALPIDPIDLYQSLYHKEGYAYLRGIQEEVLKTWHSRRGEKEVLCKMNTGSGKTLVSLMMLYSKLVEGVGTAVYVCPDNYLLEQAKKQAVLYGIPVCEITDTNQFPADFLNCKSILLCNFHKLFNAKSIFNRDNIEIGAIVIDDSHSCLDIARQNTTLEIPNTHDIFDRLITLFKTELKRQAPGSFRGLMDGDPYAKILKVPYWTWFDRKEEILDILNEFSEGDELKFKWQMICDSLDTFDCYIGPKGLQISPMIVPYESVKSFSEAKFKYILSATFEDQVDLIKDFGISEQSVLNAIIPRNRKDVGQRLILAPKRFDPTMEDSQIRNLASEIAGEGHNVVVLVPSQEKAKIWYKYGAVNLNEASNISDNIEKLKTSKGGFYVLINRYDGIDLHGNMCRLLIVDGYPRFTSYSDLYKEMRVDSIQASLKSQIIEQGLGRAVRSGSDYCAVILMGNDLVQFLGNKFNYGYFSPVTRKQVESGLTILDEEEDKTDSIKTIKNTIYFCLDQDESWRAFHNSILDEVKDDELSDTKKRDLKIAEHEKEALKEFNLRKYNTAEDIIGTKIINNKDLDLSLKHKGWYYEYAAKLSYQKDTVKSNDLQIKATMVPHMLTPRNGENYSRLNKNEEQSSMILSYIKQFNKSQDLKIHIQSVLDNLTFSPDIAAHKFETALKEAGKLFGFDAQQPENEFGNGPDVLWIMSDNHYLILEAKSMATHVEITRDNIGQLLQSGEWFKKHYGNNAAHTLVTLQSPDVKGWNVNPSENSRVIDESSLANIKNKLEQFYDAIVGKGINAVSKEDVGKLINSYEISPENFRNKFLKPIKVNNKK
ncbi:DEAD/DEAH box helicase [Chryseobacterium sp. MEBOG07]|uniref:DEAD/DEAH box helicase n=1 Tax=Chryseobacterium sp. MEBOG07 TaxID=2879939 RepID=UPI001F4912A1|nr:DEAD/DEAH box helicase family protein [Chryseobacterium sp. MEBOG07]UKB78586.1 DEAD/DEAH box helicase family protein [Chryseobacterium sp. MEBOG07]